MSRAARALRRLRREWELRRLRGRMFATPAKTSGVEECFGYTVRIDDGPNFYMQLKDEFIRQIYWFRAQREDPLIIDGGSNIGMSILYFKHLYPGARVLGFEPDPRLFQILEENIARNDLADVRLVKAALGSSKGEASFAPAGAAGQLSTGARVHVPVERLSDYLSEEVDFVKLNVEGSELDVLQEAAASGMLSNVSGLAIEYHGWAGKPQRLGTLLDLLSEHGFRYALHDFDHETNPVTKPPIDLSREHDYFLLVHARRVES
jgi:FkbM family methyltransferase